MGSHSGQIKSIKSGEDPDSSSQVGTITGSEGTSYPFYDYPSGYSSENSSELVGQNVSFEVESKSEGDEAVQAATEISVEG